MDQLDQQPITLDLEVQQQTINVDLESMAPLQGFTRDSFDVANSTITATVNNPTGADKTYRLVVHADVEAGTEATARIVSAGEKEFKRTVTFEKIERKHADIIEPVLAKAGIPLDPTQPKLRQIEALARQFKVADITIPAGVHVLRVHISQVLRPLAVDPKKFKLEMYAPLLCFMPTPNVRLAATLVLPLDFNSKATMNTVDHRPLPGLPTPQLIAGGNTPVGLGQQVAYGWLFQNVDPIIFAEYTYN